MSRLLAILSLVVCAYTAGIWPLGEDTPRIPKPLAGAIRGQILGESNDSVLQVQAICRATSKVYQPHLWDQKSGRFAFRKLPGDSTYDLLIKTSRGRRVEGIDLEYVDARLLRLACKRREQLCLRPEPKRQFTQSDVAALLKYVEDMKDFMDNRRVLFIRGHGRRATVLVELLRKRSFHARKGKEIIWRVELWYFEHRSGGWARAANVDRVLERSRMTPVQWAKLKLEYYPELSVFVDEKGLSEPVDFRAPPKGDVSRGRVVGPEGMVRTKPHVSGLDRSYITTPELHP